MRIEHVAFQVEDPVAVVQWYVKHLGFKVVRGDTTGTRTHFIADDTGRGLIEFYNNPKASVPDYTKIHTLQLHVAYVAPDIKAERDRLLAAGATLAEDVIVTPAGDELCMLRDPWGLGLQLTRRKNPMI